TVTGVQTCALPIFDRRVVRVKVPGLVDDLLVGDNAARRRDGFSGAHCDPPPSCRACFVIPNLFRHPERERGSCFIPRHLIAWILSQSALLYPIDSIDTVFMIASWNDFLSTAWMLSPFFLNSSASSPSRFLMSAVAFAAASR